MDVVDTLMVFGNVTLFVLVFFVVLCSVVQSGSRRRATGTTRSRLRVGGSTSSLGSSSSLGTSSSTPLPRKDTGSRSMGGRPKATPSSRSTGTSSRGCYMFRRAGPRRTQPRYVVMKACCERALDGARLDHGSGNNSAANSVETGIEY